MATDSIFARKFRPLVPKPISISSGTKCNTFSTMLPNASCSCIKNPNFQAWEHPLIRELANNFGDNKREIHSIPLVSTRWNPTPEQLQALEEMYKRGIRTPSSEQIQQIAAKLRRFGKIEGKNVFYWFQNHKARDRQKKRRQLELMAAGKKTRHDNTLETKSSTGLSQKYFEIGHPMKLATPNCSSAIEDTVPMHGSVMAECRKDEWTQLNQKELQQQQITTVKNETCWKLELSSCMPPSSNSSTVQTITAQRFKGQENADPYGAPHHSILLSLKSDDFEGGTEENQTLELFPIKRNDFNTFRGNGVEGTHQDGLMGGNRFVPNEFIEFLPTKK